MMSARGATLQTEPSEHRRFTVDEVLRMVEAGILGDADRVELVDGELLTVSPQGPEHGSLKDELHQRLAEAHAGGGAHVLNQRPVRMGPRGLPEPDLAVVRGEARDYLHRHPSGADVLLVVELAQTSQARDRHKAADYARGGVPVYWLIDLVARRLEVYTEPDPGAGRYRRVRSLGDGELVELPDGGARWAVSSMLP